MLLRIPPGSASAYIGDCNRLRQVLTNLMGNAVKFTGSGMVALDLSFSEAKNNKVYTTFKVTDTGIGLSEEQCKKIFDKFVQADGSVTREFGGTGLGLSISCRLVELMGGTIEVISTPGIGSTFYFSICMEKTPASLPAIWQCEKPLSGTHILLVDDNETNLEILSSHIQYWGANPTTARGSQEALNYLNEVKKSGGYFDAIILDMQMPYMNGIQLARQISDSKLSENSGIMLLLSTSDAIDLEYCNTLGICRVSNKPVRLRELYHGLISTIEGRISYEDSTASVIRKISPGELSGRVLVVEDNPVNQEMMLEVLRIFGVTADLAIHGKEAVDATKIVEYDLVLMDCQMPVLDGFSATQQIRQRESNSDNLKRLPIIALTANAMQGTKEKCLAMGMDDYLSKPIKSRHLKSVVEKWIGERGSSSNRE